jgi:hypothetical protein
VLEAGLPTSTAYQRRHWVVLLCSNQPPNSILCAPRSTFIAEITPSRSMRYSVVRVIRPEPPVAATRAAPAAAAWAVVSAVQAAGQHAVRIGAEAAIGGQAGISRIEIGLGCRDRLAERAGDDAGAVIVVIIAGGGPVILSVSLVSKRT